MSIVDRILLVAIAGGACAGLTFFATDQVIQCWEDRLTISEYRVENIVNIKALKRMMERRGL